MTEANHTDANGRVPLREHIGELFIRRDELCTTRHKELDRALLIAATEVDRRLSQLNHLREESLQDRSSYWTRKEHEIWCAEWSRWREDIAAKVTVLETRSAIWMGIIAGAFTVINTLVAIALHFVK
jgi:hypothetical protein